VDALAWEHDVRGTARYPPLTARASDAGGLLAVPACPPDACLAVSATRELKHEALARARTDSPTRFLAAVSKEREPYSHVLR